jgi:hypothetical protein
MASFWKASVELRDDNDKRTRLNLQLGEITEIDFATEAATAEQRLASYITDLKAISLANVSDIRLSVIDPGGDVDSGKPSTGSDVSEELVLVCYTDDVDQEGEVDRLRVPSPIDTVWVNDNYEEGFDLSDADADAYVENFTAGFEFSDSEHVDDTLGTNGIKAGYWRSRKMRVTPKVV